MYMYSKTKKCIRVQIGKKSSKSLVLFPAVYMHIYMYVHVYTY